MKLTTLFVTALVLLSTTILLNCSKDSEKPAPTAATELSEKELIARGKYLTTIGACNDCHSPKIMTPNGPEPDTTRLLSGHPANDPLGKVVPTKDWILFSNDLTAAVGPWGISYSANLTPDDTGIGNWTFEQFVTAIRKGKYKGIESNRSLLPPMPWQMYRIMPEEDLKAIFTYLKSLPPTKNLVPPPVPPDKVMGAGREGEVRGQLKPDVILNSIFEIH